MINPTFDPATQFALQGDELTRLRTQANQAPNQALKGAAQQFEALFLNTLLKSMREASAGDGMFDSEQSKLYTSMLDQQFAQSMSKRGIGLADMMVKQMSLHLGNTQPPATAGDAAASPSSASPVEIDPLASMRHPALARRPVEAADRSFTRSELAAPTNVNNAATATVAREPVHAAPSNPSGAKSSAQSFVERLAPHARQVSAAIGIPERFLLGHAALESGWGRREPRFADGSSSHNLFGIKADRSWKGPVVEVTTTEFINGRREVVKDKFRAYASYQEAFHDYADFLRSNPRYAHLLERQHDAVSFAKGLQRAGYATDPRYSDKLAGVINGRTMRQSFMA